MRLRSKLWLLLLGGTIVFVIGVWTDAVPLLRGPEEWRWTLRNVMLPAGRLLIPLASLTLYAFIAAYGIGIFPLDATRPARRVERSFLIFLTVAAPLIQLALAAAVWHAPLFEFFADTTSPSVTGFYSVAVTTPDLPAHLSTYSEFMQTLPIHPQTHPPGLVMLHWLAWRGFAAVPDLANSLAQPLRTLQCHNVALMSLDNAQLASAVLGMMIPLIGGFTVWPLYALGRRLIGARQAALAAAIFPVLPMFALWPAQWDQVFPLFLLTGLYFVHTGLEGRSNWRFLAAGFVFSCATFLNLGNAIMMVIAGVYMLAWWLMQASWRAWLRRANAQLWLRQFFIFAAGCAMLWLIYALIYRIPVSDLVAVGERLLHEGTRCPICPSTNRTYNVWVVWNVVDFAIFLSLPLFILLLVRLPALLKTSCASLKQKQAVVWVPLVVAVLLVFMVLDVAGIVRGEVSRLWAYWGPLFILVALTPVKTSWPARRVGLIGLLGLIGLQLFSMNTRWYVYPSFMDEPPSHEANFTPPRPQVAANVDFARQIKLVGADLSPASTHLDLNLYWQALAQPSHAYTVFVHVLDDRGNLIAQQDNMPLHDQLSTACWLPGEQVTDPYTVTLPVEGSRVAQVEVGLYRWDTGERLTRDDGAGSVWSLKLPVQ